MGWLDAGGVEELPNEFATFGAVIVEGFVGPFAGDQDAAPSDPQVFESVSFAFAASRGHGVPGTLGLDPIQQPHRTARRARGDPEFGMQPVGMITLGVGGVFIEASSLVDGLR
jgi:hypothetical protein